MAHDYYGRLIHFENDIKDFKMPYKLYGKLDKEIMIAKYMKLDNRSKGLLVRYVNGQPN